MTVTDSAAAHTSAPTLPDTTTSVPADYDSLLLAYFDLEARNLELQARCEGYDAYRERARARAATLINQLHARTFERQTIAYASNELHMAQLAATADRGPAAAEHIDRARKTLINALL